MKKNFVKLIIIAVLLIGVNASAVFALNTTNVTTSTMNNTIDNSSLTSSQIGEVREIAIEENKKDTTQDNSNNSGIGLIAVALATGLACIGAGIAVATVGASAVGAISENPKLLGKTIIFAGLAEGIAIYGLIISIMILNKL